jgi:SAM-dependent methyltransferase
LKSPFDSALKAYFYNEIKTPLTLHNDYGEPEEMPVEVLFRDEDDLSDIDNIALTFCDGKVLDIGAGTGVHTLLLQQRDIDVTALELSPMACQIMADRGVKSIINKSIYTPLNQKFDTLLLLMNGFGLAGEIDNIKTFLDRLKALLNPGGHVIVDSSDVSYMFDTKPTDHYFGEVKFCYEYNHIIGEWFNWLYIDPEMLLNIAHDNDWWAQIIYEDGNDQYLAVLKPN